MRTYLVVLAATLTLTTACASQPSSNDDSAARHTDESSASVQTNSRYGTVEELKEAAVTVGYVCKNWKQHNKVTLAAESGQCSEADVFTTFASEGDLQAQLDSLKDTDSLLVETGIEADPHLVGSNWVITGPAVATVQAELGGTLITPGD